MEYFSLDLAHAASPRTLPIDTWTDRISWEANLETISMHNTSIALYSYSLIQ